MRGPGRGRLGERGRARSPTFSLYTMIPKAVTRNLAVRRPSARMVAMDSKEWTSGFYYGIGFCFFTYSTIIALMV